MIWVHISHARNAKHEAAEKRNNLMKEEELLKKKIALLGNISTIPTVVSVQRTFSLSNKIVKGVSSNK